MRFLLDCNVLSEQRKPRPDAGLLNWLTQNHASAAISELTLAELWKGCWRIAPGKRREATFGWIEELREVFEERTLALDIEVLKRWAELCAKNEMAGRRLAVMDSLLAATALVHDLVVVTRNTSDFPTEVRTLNPWKK